MRFNLILLLLLGACSVFGQKNIELRGVQPYGQDLSDIWGYSNNGREYALVGVYDGLSIVDVTDPENLDPLFFIRGANSIWRDIKTWNDHAYVTNESDSGLLIVDLTDLPNSIQHSYWTADTLLKSAHNIYIDENGFAYIFGYNSLNGRIPYDERGAIIADLNNDPKQPVVAALYNQNYVHDGYVRGDTMWTSETTAGYFAAVDVSDKNNLQVMVTAETPSRFTHNAWLSDDGSTLFTTDEVESGYIASYNVSNFNNIIELNRYRESPGTGLIPHNTHVFGNYLWNSYYTYGVNLVDATRPENLVETGRYDTSPIPDQGSFSGCWGVYPFLPSGNILASDVEEGLFVLTPSYTRACYLEGTITDETTNAALNNIKVELLNTNKSTTSAFDGLYKTGIVDSGFYDVRVSYPGCPSKIFTDVLLEKGVVKTLNISMDCQPTSVYDPFEKDLQLNAQPNVFAQNTQVFFRGLKEKGTLQIFNLSGQEMKSLDLNESSGFVTLGQNWPNGFYLVVLTTEKDRLVQKIQKL